MVKKLTPMSEDFNQWYTDIIQEAQLADYSPVKGTMVIRPYGYALWEHIQSYLDKRFKDTGHQNAYFPLFIPKSFIEKEAEHVEGFSPELATVTHAGGKELEEPLIVRPTSETIINHMFSKWIKSHRDLPMLINQWANVVRWEMRTRLFLRTSEFLWQEGHTAHQTKEEATQEALQMLDIYEEFTEKIAAVKVIKGTKSEIEKFAGAKVTYSIEAMMLDKKALQAGTSHELGQNFSKAFEIQYSDENNNLAHPFQTSWGVSTRLIGMIIMAHGDDQGLKLPPAIAPTQVVIIPIIPKNADSEKILKLANQIKEMLSDFRVHLDDREEVSPGFKFNEWELKGVPIRLELGPKDIENNSVVVARRDIQNTKTSIPINTLDSEITSLLDTIQNEMLKVSEQFLIDNTSHAENMDELLKQLQDSDGFVSCYWSESKEDELRVKEQTKATIRCYPLEHTNEMSSVNKPEIQGKFAIFSKSY
ncbi:MAG: proline--tRNA ligase [Actinobacteria bacterium]|jgi:prolyl-tRNA synthetase|nr:proline--tRNA ligase [Actinomycetota bacterium]MBT5655960.1 proline--tRNA ligase [Actinomycetota bacterium]MBT7014398.1 proline--tRNA ligase [Actinomycetota bacterium]